MNKGARVSQYRDNKSMSSAALDQDAKRWATVIEDGEARRLGRNIEEVRPIVANRLGVAPGTIERLRKGRVKGVKTWLYGRLRGLVIEELQREIHGLQHELFLARQSGVGAGDDAIIAAQTHIAAAQELLKESAQ